MPTQITTNAPYALPAGAGKAMGWFGSTVTLKASCPEMGVTEVLIHPGEEPPLHLHKNEDEWFYMLEGEVTFHVGGENHQGTAGAFVSFPRGIPHTFTVESPAARFLVMNTPGGFERMFELAPKTDEEAFRALTAFGMKW
jgi:quercetin dioxygenase-like cupin family protein